MSISLADKPVGRAHELVEPRAGGGARTRTSWTVRIGRLGTAVEMASDLVVDEDADGHLRRVHAAITLSRQTSITEVELTDHVATISDGVHARTVALAESLIGPDAIRRANAAKLRASGDTLDYTTWSPQLSAPQKIHCAVAGRETVTIDGVPTALVRVTVEAEGEGTHLAWINDTGREVRTSVTLPFGTMVTTVTRGEPTAATEDMDADFFAATLVRSNVRLPQARSLDSMTVRIDVDDPKVPVPDTTIARARAPAPSDPELATPAVAANRFIDPSDPQVRAIAREAAGDVDDSWQRAIRLTHWVTDHMTFDGGVAFAPVAELARDRHGTCAGYAVMLASLLRASGIPSRLDLGLVYVDGVFAGHAWVEAFVHGRWIPLDAAIPSDGPADAARIVVTRDDLDRGPGAALAPLGRFLGHAKIAVVGYTRADHAPVEVDPAAAPYKMDGSRYINPGLGLTVTAPAGYHFSNSDAVWPDPTIVALDGPMGHVAILEASGDPVIAIGACDSARSAGLRTCTHRELDRVRVAVGDGPTLYIIDARGSQAAELADIASRGLRLTDASR